MKKNFNHSNPWDYIPLPICEDKPEYSEFYKKAWDIAYDHIKEVEGMPQTPYMDEGFCDTQLWIFWLILTYRKWYIIPRV